MGVWFREPMIVGNWERFFRKQVSSRRIRFSRQSWQWRTRIYISALTPKRLAPRPDGAWHWPNITSVLCEVQIKMPSYWSKSSLELFHQNGRWHYGTTAMNGKDGSIENRSSAFDDQSPRQQIVLIKPKSKSTEKAFPDRFIVFFTAKACMNVPCAWRIRFWRVSTHLWLNIGFQVKLIQNQVDKYPFVPCS